MENPSISASSENKFVEYPTHRLASTLAVIRAQNIEGATMKLGDEIEEELKIRRDKVGDEGFIQALTNRMAEISVSSSALRNQGAPGIIATSRKYFKNVDLLVFSQYLNRLDYKEYLDDQTEMLLDKFPEEGKSWGAARKGINLFFREVCYNYYLRRYLALPPDHKDSSLSRLEIPLDKDVAEGLKIIYPDLPRWHSIKSLSPEENTIYQVKAKKHAETKGTLRIHLDMEFWRANV